MPLRAASRPAAKCCMVLDVSRKVGSGLILHDLGATKRQRLPRSVVRFMTAVTSDVLCRIKLWRTVGSLVRTKRSAGTEKTRDVPYHM